MSGCDSWHEPQFQSDQLEHFVGQGPLTPEELEITVRRFKKAVIERALGRELTHHLRYPLAPRSPTTPNHRNGTSEKTVLTDDGPLTLDVPRDRDSSCEPRLVAKHDRPLQRLRRRFHQYGDRRGDDGDRRVAGPATQPCIP